MNRCEQCGDAAHELSDTEYGLLCLRCAWRQAEHDDRGDRFDHLSPTTFGFDPTDE